MPAMAKIAAKVKNKDELVGAHGKNSRLPSNNKRSDATISTGSRKKVRGSTIPNKSSKVVSPAEKDPNEDLATTRKYWTSRQQTIAIQRLQTENAKLRETIVVLRQQLQQATNAKQFHMEKNAKLQERIALLKRSTAGMTCLI